MIRPRLEGLLKVEIREPQLRQRAIDEILAEFDRLTAANKQLMEVITRLQPISTISFEDWEAVKKAGEEA